MTRCRMALLLATTLLLAGWDGMQSALDANGAGAIGIKQLIIGIVTVCTVVWLLVIIVLIRALMRRLAQFPMQINRKYIFTDQGIFRR